MARAEQQSSEASPSDRSLGPLAAVSLVAELGAPLALLHPRVGRWWCALAWSFHAGVVVMMAIVFHYPLAGVAYASFFRVEALAERWDRSMAVRAGRRRASAESAAA